MGRSGNQAASETVASQSAGAAITGVGDAIIDLGSDGAGDIVKSLLESDTTKKLAKALGSTTGAVLGGIGGELAELGIGLLLDALKDSDTSKDQIQIMDFDPTEDMVIQPFDQSAGELLLVAQQLSDEVVIDLQYEVEDGSIKTFARLHLAQEFQEAVGIYVDVPDGATASKLLKAKAIIQCIVAARINLNETEMSNTVPDEGTSLEELTSLRDASAVAFGSVAPLLRAGAVEDKATIGSRFGDVSTANTTIIDPGEEERFGNITGAGTVEFISELSVEIYGFGGHDTIVGGLGSDRLFGGDGDDTIWTYGTKEGTDFALGGAGDDTVIAGTTRNNLPRYDSDGGDGWDTFDFTYYSIGQAYGVAIGIGADADGAEIAYGRNWNGRRADPLGAVDPENARFQLAAFEEIQGTRDRDYLDVSDATSRWTVSGGKGDDVIILGAVSGMIARGGDGADQLTGGFADARLSYSDSNGSVSVNLVTNTVSGVFADGDVIEGFAGVIGSDFADTLTANGGRVDGSGSNDKIFGTDQVSDVPLGDDGNDTIIGKVGNGRIAGGNDKDNLRGDAGTDTIWGGAGNDVIKGGDGNDVINGQNGNDKICGGAGDDELDGGQGDDILSGGAGQDTLSGDTGDDRLFGGSGDDTLTASFGDDRLFGGAGNDNLTDGVDGDDLLNGGAGNDTLSSGKDILFGGSGNDMIDGGEGDDILNGGADDDTMNGAAGRDTLNGGSGNDVVTGGQGDDDIMGGTGNDTLWGESRFVADSSDFFVFSVGDGQDIIADFQDIDKNFMTGDITSADIMITETSKENWTIVCSDQGDSFSVAANLASFGLAYFEFI
ncbi:MAG: calcium-binding protein [Sedimentitalea sp.]